MSTQEIVPITHRFVASLVELVETNVAHRLQEAIASVSVGFGAISVANSVRRGSTPTPRMIQARKLQGQYMAAVRGLKPHDRNRVDKLTRAKGAVAGLALARSLGLGPKYSRKPSRPFAAVKPRGNVGLTPHHSELIR